MHHLSFPLISRTARKRILSFITLETVSKPEAYNISLVIILSLQPVIAVTTHIREVLETNRKSNFENK